MKPASLSSRFFNFVQFYTIIQWEKIDEEYKKEDKIDIKAIITFLAIIIVLTFDEYFTKSTFFKGFMGIGKSLKSNMSHLPYNELYPYLYWIISSTINNCLIPILVIKFVFQERVVDYGFKLKKDRQTLLLYFSLFLCVIPLVYLVSFTPAFQMTYPFYKLATRSYVDFFVWEIGYGSYYFMLEFFFRGFMLFTLVRYFGAYAIFIMVIPYTMIHYGKPLAETLGAIFAGTALGTLALRTRSIYGGVIIHSTIAWSMDVLSLYQQGKIQSLFGF